MIELDPAVVARLAKADNVRRLPVATREPGDDDCDDEPVDPEPSTRGSRRRRAHAPAGNAVRISTAIHEAVDGACDALARAEDLYQRDGELVHVVTVAQDSRDSTFVAPGSPRLYGLRTGGLRERLTRCATFERFDARSEDWRPCLPPPAVLEGVMDRHRWTGVRHLVAVTESPTMRPDGSILDVPGYDTATGWLYVPAGAFQRVAAAPTQADAAAALQQLEELLLDFPHVARADRSVTLAAALTILARPAITGATPGFVLDASTRGSGKTLQADVITMIATGRSAPRMSWPHDEIELEKILGGYALRSAQIACFDNITTPFGGGPLDRCLTAVDAVELRVLGKSDVPTFAWRTVVIGTGQNVVVHGDTVRRVLVSRLEPADEHPEERTGFRHSDLLGYIAERRGELVRAALTILRAYVVAGRPDVGTKTWGSFEAWSRLVPPALVYAGGIDPMTCRPVATGREESDKTALLALLDGLERLDPDGRGTKARDIVALLYPDGRPRQGAAPDRWDDMREAIETIAPPRPGATPTAHGVGNALNRLRGRVAAGRRLATTRLAGHVVGWVVERMVR